MGRRAIAALAALAALPATGAAAQDVAIPPSIHPELSILAGSIEGFVPPGWRLEARADGELNGDGKPDAAVVLRESNPANVLADTMCEERFDTNPRILLVLFAEPGGGYRMVAKSHELIPRRENPCEVDPFSDPGQIAIKAGTLRLDLERMMSAGGWDAGTAGFKWRWRDGAVRLIGFDYSNVKRNTGDETLVSVNYLTGLAKISTGNIGTDREKVRWATLRNRRAPTLDGIGDGLMFDPDALVSNLP
ncbi:MAG: hypothetical protein ABWX67_10400 [Allosphingosinicella sp.]